MAGKTHTADSPPPPDLEALNVTLEVSASVSATRAAIPLEDLQARKNDPSDEVQVSSAPEATSTAPDLPPIDKRGFLTLFAQHLSRCVSIHLQVSQQASG